MRLLRRGVIPFAGQVPPPNERQILRALRIPHAERVADVEERGVREAIELAARRARGMASFTAVLRTARVKERTSEGVLVEGAPPGLLCSDKVAHLLEPAEEVAFLAVTLGERWDEELDALVARGEPAEAWFLDALGTHLVDQAARAVEARVASDMTRAGLTRTPRYRPGYGDWPLEAQADLCAFVESARIGVHPNEAMSLLPRKSVTGVVGFGPALPTASGGNPG
jgi:hypothetical protein